MRAIDQSPRLWPEADLESVSCCPVCRRTERRLMYAGMTDRVFGVADGAWDLYQCTDCSCAYLNPRPSVASIGRAYAGYYTHDVEDHPIVRRIGVLRKLLHDLINGYQNARYGLKRTPASALGRFLLPLLPPLRAAADSECRHLPRIPAQGGRLLDVGCGNGGFLNLARQANWDVEGLDFDAEAVRAARSRNLNVRCGGIDTLDGRRDYYDVITLCHVIEHVHDPVATLRKLYAMLKPSGTLWIDTPNLFSMGSIRFGVDWRDLDPPRHLVLFNPSGLRKCLSEVGFHSLKQYSRGLTVFEVFAASEAIERGSNPMKASYQGRPTLRSVVAELSQMMRPSRREFITMTAKK